MKLIRYRDNEYIKPGVLDKENNIRDASTLVNDWTSKTINLETIQKVKNVNIIDLPTVDKEVSIAPCIGGVGKFICIGLNYADHAAESGMEVPSEPIVFMKATSAICGPNDDIIIPKDSKKIRLGS